MKKVYVAQFKDLYPNEWKNELQYVTAKWELKENQEWMPAGKLKTDEPYWLALDSDYDKLFYETLIPDENGVIRIDLFARKTYLFRFDCFDEYGDYVDSVYKFDFELWEDKDRIQRDGYYVTGIKHRPDGLVDLIITHDNTPKRRTVLDEDKISRYDETDWRDTYWNINIDGNTYSLRKMYDRSIYGLNKEGNK